MPKRSPALHPQQMAFSFDAPMTAVEEGALANLDRLVASAVGQMLSGDARSRYEIAGQVSELLGEDVSKLMLDAYASESRDRHNISLTRFFALVLATNRFDALDALLRQIGCSVLVGEEIKLAEASHLRAQARDIARRLKQLDAQTQPIARGRK